MTKSRMFLPSIAWSFVDTTAKYSMNNSHFLSTKYLSGGGAGVYFGHSDIIRENERVQ